MHFCCVCRLVSTVFEKMSFSKPTFKRPPTRSTRQQESSGSDDDDDERESSVVVKSRKKQKKNPMIQSTSSFSRKNEKTHPNNDNNDDDDDDSDEYESIKQNPVNFGYESTKSTEREGPADMGATSTLEIDSEKDQSTSKTLKNEDDDNDPNDNVYRGANNYAQFKQKRDAPKGFIPKGPVRAPENIRSTVRWDYQPDICKDYKETGFCGFGDSCKFLHDRSDYKAGWQIDLEMKDTKRKKPGDEEDDEDEDDHNKYKIDDDDELPFACFICRESFKEPVVTRCKHYFCLSCAMGHYSKSTKCFVCSAPTSGVFNHAKEIDKRMKLKQSKSESTNNDQDESDDDDNNDNEDDIKQEHLITIENDNSSD